MDNEDYDDYVQSVKFWWAYINKREEKEGCLFSSLMNAKFEEVKDEQRTETA